jgi:RNA-directed DNA polymerase
VLRLLRKWLTAGVLEEGAWKAAEQGTPQGAVISPLLANLYLHYALDLWVQQWRRRHARGEMIFVRYADDFVIGFQHQQDAVAFQRDLAERLRQFSLELHPDKTRLLRFGRFAAAERQRCGLKGSPETFSFLGFTHFCGRTRQGAFLVLRRTQRERMRAKLKEVKAEMMRRRHLPLAEQGKWLGQVVRGYFAYHAVPTNIRALASFRTQAIRHWRVALGRRSQRGSVVWARMKRLGNEYLPTPRVLHPWPEERFDARIQGKSRVR